MAVTTSSKNPLVSTLLSATAQSVLQVAIIAVVGYFLARRGILDKQTQARLNRINVSTLTTSLLFSKIAFALTPQKLLELWSVPAGWLAVTLVSAATSYLLSAVFRLTRPQRNFAIACAISPNSNSLPVALMQSMIGTVPGLKWTPNDNPSAMLGRALTYMVLFSTLGQVLRWSVGAHLLQAAEEAPPTPCFDAVDRLRHRGGDEDDERWEEEDGGGRMREDERAAEEEEDAALLGRTAVNVGVSGANGTGRSASLRPPAASRLGGRAGRHNGPVWRSFPNSPVPSTTSLSTAAADEEEEEEVTDEDEVVEMEEEEEEEGRYGYRRAEREREEEEEGMSDPEWGPPPPHLRHRSQHGHRGQGDLVTEPTHSRLQSLLRCLRRRTTSAGRSAWKVVRRTAKRVNAFCTMPMYAAIASLLVASIGPLQTFLACLTPLRGALQSAGDCSIPLTLLTLGSYFYSEPSPTPPSAAVAAASRGQARARTPARRSPPSSATTTAASSPLSFGSAKLRGKASLDEVERRRWSASADTASSSNSPAPAAVAERERGRGRMMTRGEGRTVAVAVFSRMVLTPLVLVPVLAWWAIKTRRNVADDPIFITSACLLIGSPPALTLAQIASKSPTLTPTSTLPRLISRTIFVSYALLAAPVTVLLVLAALLIGELDELKG